MECSAKIPVFFLAPCYVRGGADSDLHVLCPRVALMHRVFFSSMEELVLNIEHKNSKFL